MNTPKACYVTYFTAEITQIVVNQWISKHASAADIGSANHNSDPPDYDGMLFEARASRNNIVMMQYYQTNSLRYLVQATLLSKLNLFK